jgi:hypothetical protein
MSGRSVQVIVNSADRISGSYSSFTIKLNTVQSFKVRRARLVSAQIPVCWPVFSGNYDSAFAFSEQAGGGVVLASIVGSYTLSSLLPALASAMNSVSPNSYTYSVSLNSNFNTLTITGSGSWRVEANSKYPCNKLLGFNNSTGTYSLSQTGQNSCSLSPPLYVGIQIPELSNNNVSSTNPGFSPTFIVPIKVNSFAVSYFSENMDWVQTTEPGGNFISNLTITLVDPIEGTISDMSADWSFVLILQD